jgi:RNA polymerase sigma factor (sigma-70 family)
MTDRDLMVAFARDRSAEAFGELACRHAPMVYSTCLRLLRDPAESEDAAQAVFLVLWRREAAVSDGAALGAWLHRAAELTAHSYRKVRARRRRHEWEAAQMRCQDSTGVTAAEDEEIRDRIDAAMAALPPRQREVVVLQYLEGRTHSEIAAELGVHVKTVAYRLSGALEALRGRLARRGVPISGAVLAAWLSERSVEAMPEHLVTSITAACAGGAAAGPMAEAAEGVLKALAWGKMKVVAATLAAATFAASGTGVYLSMAGGKETPPAPEPIAAAAPAASGPVDLIDATTPRRAHLVCGFKVARERGALMIQARGKPVTFDPAADEKKAGLTTMPPADWVKADFDDQLWGRYQPDELNDYLGGYGVWTGGDIWPALLCLRTCFGIADPAKATDVTVTVACIGGGVVYVNGREVGRGHMPAGALHPLTPAEDYPPEVYVTEDGQTPLPALLPTVKPDAKWRERYEKRSRTFAVSVPAAALVKGRNVLAVELHRSAVAGPLERRGGWSHLGIRDVRATSAGGDGVIPYAEAVKGTRVWNAQAVEQVTETLPQKSLTQQSWMHNVTTRGQPVKGTAMANPYDPLRPVKILAPRNGTGSGQVVLSDLSGLKGVSAGGGVFKGPGGAALPEGAVRIRYAAQPKGEMRQGDRRMAPTQYCDALMEKPPADAKTVPVWLLVEAPRDQAPGWYASELSLEANGRRFTVPVRVFVTAFTAPKAKDFRSLVGVMHSPESVAATYKVEPWSEAHFKLMAKSLELAGRLGNDVMYVPVILDTHMGHQSGLIRWVKADTGPRPDFSLFEKYLDLYVKQCGPPRAISLYVWSHETAKESAGAYEGSQVPLRQHTPKRPLRVTLWDPKTGTAAGIPVPAFVDDGAETFWKPMLDGVHEIVVKKRGWPEKIILLGCGCDSRPSPKTGELARRWAPYARWDIYSHFSGDPGSMFYDRKRGAEDATLKALKAGKMIAVGDLEVGLKEVHTYDVFSASQWRAYWQKQAEQDFLELFIHRLVWNEQSPPMTCRTVPLFTGRLARIGLDFWPVDGRQAYQVLIWGTYPIQLAWPGPDGAQPTVRFQMVREALQDVEARWAILDALPKLPPDRQQVFSDLFGDLGRRVRTGEAYLSQVELGLDWPSYAARLHQAAAELAGVKTDVSWSQSPLRDSPGPWGGGLKVDFPWVPSSR